MNKDAKYLRFVNPFSGRDPDKEKAQKYRLIEGKVYEVKKITEHGWSTDVYLKDFPGVFFNSVQFEEADIGETQI